MIPKIIHQIWYDLGNGKEIPDRLQRYQESWKSFHPDWEHKLWSEENGRDLIQEHYPFFLKTYDNYPYGIQRVDAVRYLILYAHGGLYADLDYECFRSLNETIEKNKDKNIFLSESQLKFNIKFFHNGLLISSPGHPFLSSVIKALEDNKKKKWYYRKNLYVIKSTGPGLISHCYKNTENKNDIFILPQEIFTPRLRRKNELSNDVICFHHASASWLSSNKMRTVVLKAIEKFEKD